MESFGGHLARYPHLGLDHEVGRRILSIVRRAPKLTLRDALWHRARLPSGPDRHTAAQMGPPPANWTEGRFNHHGQSVFRLASSIEGACAETAAKPRCILWGQHFRARQSAGCWT
ncbi:RES family NAD+ phosphorylase [Siccirubricoccus sp. KC 17139]|uniref:RES family NAD+ phosphorylase n=1 Tax=Siccirubricoccus soli TaxID=2899147 RepID=A0ABT1D5C7_9PROT|nr:RES domain-containing protein [Siccirubricoccus soli]MCO6416500.1 RES family NAD+ phosphorylase [Siccirubricoccus soli]MCP2682634.1 RES family NAD+ phosphorylase [Siccirubricoccus soli]